MTYDTPSPDGHALRTASDALREASLSKQAILAHEKQCAERYREITEAMDRLAADLRTYLAQSRESRTRLHERVDQANDRIAENQTLVSRGLTDLRNGMIKGLFATLLSLAGTFSGVVWYILTAMPK